MLAFMLSGVALAVVGLPSLHHTTHKPGASLVMFPIMVVGVGAIGIVLTAATEGSRLTLQRDSQSRRKISAVPE